LLQESPPVQEWRPSLAVVEQAAQQDWEQQQGALPADGALIQA
jgi:hypothetical protein